MEASMRFDGIYIPMVLLIVIALVGAWWYFRR